MAVTTPHRTTMRIPKRILKAADKKAGKEGLSRTRYIIALIERDTGVVAFPTLPVAEPADSNIFG